MTDATDDAAGDDERPRILALDDEERVCQAFQIWLRDGYEVEYATSGADGLAMMDDGIDLVLLDRHMPGMSGGEVLEEIREADYDCRVLMVTAVDPDFDIVDMPFDDYLSKPVDQETLQATVDRLLQVDTYDDQMSELYAVSQKLATLETETSAAAREESTKYAELVDRRDELQATLTELGDRLETDDENLFDVVDIAEK
ncbi:response regulator [Halosegnis sp.]|uniref:response regulator n=1 Tax=Halosegnis sp. TaxID=2864959 RepID=UPI0035D4DA01